MSTLSQKPLTRALWRATVQSAALLAIAGSALAAETAATGTSTSSGKSTLEKIKEKAQVTLSSQLYGAALSDPLSPKQPDETTGQRSPVPLMVANSLGMFYKVTPTFLIGPVVRFDVVPVEGGQFNAGDTYLRILKNKLIDAGNLTLNADLRIGAPFSRISQDRGKLVNISSRQVLNYNFGKSIWSTTLVTHLDTIYYSSAGNGGGNMLYYWGNLGVNAQVWETLGFNVSYELDGMVNRRGGGPVHAGDYLDVGASWDATPWLNVNPFIDFKPMARFNADTTTYNLVLTARVL